MAHKHQVYDTDLHFKIDPVTRAITSESGKVILMQNDHNSERFTFEIPRSVEGHDMSVCNVVEIHYVNTDASNKRNTHSDIYPITDLQVSPDSDDVVILSWLISQNATMYAGTLHFIIRFACITNDVIEYQWFTDVYKVITIAKGLYNTDVVTEEGNPDVLAVWKEEILASIEIYKSISDAGTLGGHPASYFAAKNTSGQFTAAQVGAVDKTGDTMTGNLKITRSEYPSLRAVNSTAESEAMFTDYGNAAVFESRNFEGNTADRRRLFLRNTTSVNADISKALSISNTVEGSNKEYFIYGEHNKPAPGDIGAAKENHTHAYVPVAGGSMTDNLLISKSSYPAVRLNDTKLGTELKLTDFGFAAALETRNILETMDNRRLLLVRNTTASKKDISEALLIRDVVAGAEKEYLIYGEHNKPTPAAIGAVALSGGTMTDNLTISKSDYPAVSLMDVSEKSEARLSNYGTAAVMETRPVFTDITTRRRLILRNSNNSVSEIAKSVYVSDSYPGSGPGAEDVVKTYYLYGEHNKPAPKDIGAAATDHKHNASDINAGTLGVGNGGTGGSSFTAGEALVGNGANAFATRAIQNLTDTAEITRNNSLVTANSLHYHVRHMVGRATAVGASNTAYTSYMARGIALVNAEPDSMVNGAVAFVY